MSLAGFALIEDVYPEKPAGPFPIAESRPRVVPRKPRRKKARPAQPAALLQTEDNKFSLYLVLSVLVIVILILACSLVRSVNQSNRLAQILISQSYMRPQFLPHI